MTNTNTSKTVAPVILMREGTQPRYQWRQYIVVTDNRVAIVHMTPALWGGWNFDRVDVQGDADWMGKSRDAIVAWKMQNDDGRTQRVENLPSSFLAMLLKNAALGRIDTQAIDRAA